MIALERIGRRFGPFSLAVDLRVERGAYLVILGPSGSGKSLLLGTLAGIYPPEQGRVLLAGREVTREPPERRGLGFVFQRAALFPHLGVAENISFGLRARGETRLERRTRVAELSQRLGLTGLMERPVTALSGGEAQRVAIARALAPRPRVLLLDEPLSLIDHNARLELQEELRRLHAELELTTIHVTHHREEARALATHCAVMLGGRIVQQGAREAVFDRPRCLFVSRFLGLDRPPPATPACAESCLGTGRCDAPSEA